MPRGVRCRSTVRRAHELFSRLYPWENTRVAPVGIVNATANCARRRRRQRRRQRPFSGPPAPLDIVFFPGQPSLRSTVFASDSRPFVAGRVKAPILDRSLIRASWLARGKSDFCFREQRRCSCCFARDAYRARILKQRQVRERERGEGTRTCGGHRSTVR